MKTGKHKCKVLLPDNGWFGESGEKKTPFFRLPLLITSGPCEGERIEWTGWLTSTAAEGTLKRLAEVFGWDENTTLTGGDPFVGKECSIEVEEDEYNGHKRMRVKWLNRASSPPLAEGSALAIAERFARLAKAVANKRKAETGVTETPPASDDLAKDEIPF